MATRINYIDVYCFYSDLEADVIESLMEGFSISFSIRTLGPYGQATDPTGFPEKRIAVEQDMADNARKILRDAINKGVISGEGKFVG
ncbi:MAG TPA: hypothetical protein VJM57_07105 [Thermodesulfobacteriota bacterium]|nr:hypothetical protein [Thermodesulfobacteriota bacterium]